MDSGATNSGPMENTARFGKCLVGLGHSGGLGAKKLSQDVLTSCVPGSHIPLLLDGPESLRV